MAAMRATRRLRDGTAPSTLASLLGLAAPWSCAGCGRPEVPWCADCVAALAGPVRFSRPEPTPPELPRLLVRADYAGPVRAGIVAWKDRGRRDLVGPFAAALAPVLQAAIDLYAAHDSHADIAIVPVPSARTSVRRRGEDVLRRLVRHAVELVPCGDADLQVVTALELVRATRDQSGLDADERRANLAGAMCCRRYLDGPVIVVDDIVTTGATLAEAARALTASGAEVVGAVALAATQRRGRATSHRSPRTAPT